MPTRERLLVPFKVAVIAGQDGMYKHVQSVKVSMALLG